MWPGNRGPEVKAQLAAVSRIVPDLQRHRLFGTRAGMTARGSPLRVPPGTKAADGTTAGRSSLRIAPLLLCPRGERTPLHRVFWVRSRRYFRYSIHSFFASLGTAGSSRISAITSRSAERLRAGGPYTSSWVK